MIKDKIRVRFAPSPTGELHIGNARTALFNWLYARQNGGDFILRIEDTDRVRTKESFEANLFKDLSWLGLDWTEGPGKEGGVGPYRQTERIGIYNVYLEKLISAGLTYPCYCSEDELEMERKQQIARHTMPRYNGACRNLSSAECKKLDDEGKKPAYRFKVEDGLIEFNDMIRGAMKFSADSIGDFIIVRSNGLPAYNFAVVIDDYLMNITHVIRGEDHLSNTALQILLYRALEFSPPTFAHHSLILGKDRAKLSKRHGSVTVSEFRNSGILAEALINYLALLGNSFGEGREICDSSELISLFNLSGTGKSGAVFDAEKLLWLNGAYIKKHPSEKLLTLMEPFLDKNKYDLSNVPDLNKLTSIVSAVKENIHTLKEINDYLGIFNDDEFSLPPEARLFLSRDSSRNIIKSLHHILTTEDLAESNFYYDAIKKLQIITGEKGRAIFLPIRYALTGSASGPELDKISALIGKRSVIMRLEQVLDN